MRVMVIVKANEASERGEMPSQELLEAMMAFNEELVKAGLMLAGDGLKPSSNGVRVHFSGKDRTVTDGPFAETKEVLGGYYLVDCADLDRALELAARIPDVVHGSVEVRPLQELGQV